MLVKQISIFLENKEGRLAELTSILAEAGININALTIADTSDFGILRIIVDDVKKTEKLLKEYGFSVSVTDVVAIDIDNVPGGIARPLSMLHENGISVEYIYAFLAKKDDTAHVIFKVNDVEAAVSMLIESGFRNTAKL
ncbi:MAG TPA: ACT domain-containing protein [Clostridia bacterium]|nr:ACT domain-containing protein [Clostridia bacterium]HQO68676.1 ACT domain-containing protein [Clostridia bacterium]